jgi:DNA-3-methyladenine glycosylase I
VVLAVRKKKRCAWAGEDPLYVSYHDEEWGVPSFDDSHLFEHLVLEGAQAGLAWITVLRKRERYRKRFSQFDPARVARYDSRRIESLLKDAGLIRNRLKINSAVKNARQFLRIQREFGSFHRYLWSFAPQDNPRDSLRAPRTMADLPVTAEASDRLARDLKSRGMSFVGPTCMYAYMQAVGMVNDHVVDCFRRGTCERARRRAIASLGKKK